MISIISSQSNTTNAIHCYRDFTNPYLTSETGVIPSTG